MMNSSKLYGRKALSLAVSVLALGVSGAAFAGSDTASFAVSASVPDNCVISANPLAFGNYDAIAGTAVNGQANLAVTCTNGSTGTISLDEGLNGVGTAAAPDRQMDDDTTGLAFLAYELYNDSARTTEWGTGAGDVTHNGDGTEQTHTVYGRITADQNTAVADTYSDTVIATVSF